MNLNFMTQYALINGVYKNCLWRTALYEVARTKTGLKWPILGRFLNFKGLNPLENNEDAINSISSHPKKSKVPLKGRGTWRTFTNIDQYTE